MKAHVLVSFFKLNKSQGIKRVYGVYETAKMFRRNL